jgi:hypothetical protein
MLPVVDYGSIAIVIPKVTAVGSIINDDEKPGLEVFLTGMEEPVIIGFETREEALEAREELIGIIAQFHYIKELGPDFEFSDLLNKDGNDDVNEH